MNKKSVKKLILSGLFIAIGVILPFVTSHTIPTLSKVLLPMHFPIFLCGLICGWQYGLAVGIITPLLASVITAMPALYPDAVAMSVELATYGAVSGLASKKLPTIPSLVIAMLAGRVTMGVTKALLLGVGENAYTLSAFVTAAFTRAIPGIIAQLVLIPIIVYQLRKTQNQR